VANRTELAAVAAGQVDASRRDSRS